MPLFPTQPVPKRVIVFIPSSIQTFNSCIVQNGGTQTRSPRLDRDRGAARLCERVRQGCSAGLPVRMSEAVRHLRALGTGVGGGGGGGGGTTRTRTAPLPGSTIALHPLGFPSGVASCQCPAVRELAPPPDEAPPLPVLDADTKEAPLQCMVPKRPRRKKKGALNRVQGSVWSPPDAELQQETTLVWMCAMCTFENEGDADACAICQVCC